MKKDRLIEVNQIEFEAIINEARSYDLKIIGYKIKDVMIEQMDFRSFLFENCVFDHAMFQGCDFSLALFKNVAFDFCDLSNSKSEQTLYDHVKMTHTKAIGLKSYQSVFKSCKFKDTLLKYASFNESKMTKVTFDHCQLELSDFSMMNKLDVTFESCDCLRINFFKTSLSNVDLSSSNIEGMIISDHYDELRQAILSREQMVDIARSLLKIIPKE